MIEYLNSLDHQLFYFIVTSMRFENLDALLSVWRDKYFWFPLYLGLILWLVIHYKKWIYYLLAITILITTSDQLSSGILKKLVKRERPCRELVFKDTYSPLIHCSGAFSFPSSHACNHMALAVFLFFACRDTMSLFVRRGLILWAISIGFAQIYVGVHFPFDVLFGLILGSIIGWGISMAFSYIISKVLKVNTA